MTTKTKNNNEEKLSKHQTRLIESIFEEHIWDEARVDLDMEIKQSIGWPVY